MWTEEIAEDVESLDDHDKQILTITIGRFVVPGEGIVSGQWTATIDFKGVALSRQPFQSPSVAIGAAIAQVDKRFGIKVSDKN